MTQWWTGKNLCPVQIWNDIVTRLESYPGTSYESPINKVCVENCKTTITSKITIKILRSVMLSFGEDDLGFSHKEGYTHSVGSEFCLEIFLEIVYP